MKWEIPQFIEILRPCIKIFWHKQPKIAIDKIRYHNIVSYWY